MKTTRINLFLFCLLAIFLVLSGSISRVRADTPLDSSNWAGSDGAHYWRITESGNYYLNVVGDTFSTTYNYAIWISSSNVVFDGKGKTITGIEGESDVYGVIVNAGSASNHVHIKNLKVERKRLGVIFEAISYGTIENVNASNNTYGIYLWNGNHNIITGNTTKENAHTGVTLDADNCTNSYNTITDNITTGNTQFGILLWLSCPNATISGNTANNNGNMGIVVSGNSNDCSLTGNTANNNPNGIYVKDSNSNKIIGNTLNGNTNVGLWLDSSNENTITGNVITNSQNAGIWLTSSSTNSIRENTITNNQYWGIFLDKNNNNQTIYNNYFNNPSGNAGISSTNTGNKWNISKTQSENIVGGPYLGGNFWGKPDGSGFSQVTADSDGDGICDSAYTLSAGNVDGLPLHAYSTATELYVNHNDSTCGGNSPCYATIQDAINSASTEATIRVAQGGYTDSFMLIEAKELTVDGGWDSSFTTQTPNTTIIKPPTISHGSITFLNLTIRP